MSDALFSLLIGSAVRTTVILAVALLVARQLMGRSAAIRHAVFTAAVVGAIVVPILALILPEMRAPFLARAVSSGLEWLQRPIRSLRSSEVAGRADGGATDGALADDITLQLSQERAPVSHGAVGLAILWAAGVIVVGGRTVVRVRRAAQLARRANPVRDVKILATARAIAERTRQPMPRVLETREVSAPATVGVLRSAILLPVARSWSDEHMRTVLAHELAHVARRDCLTQHLAHVVCALHWFNPLAWIVERRMALERERACDDIAMREATSPDGYAMLLLDFVRRECERALPPTAMLAMAQPSELETRLLAILDPVRDRGKLTRRARWALTGLASVTVALFGILSLEAAPLVPNAAAQGRVEPDTRNDSVAHPSSERIARASLDVARRRGRVVLAGPDSALARVLLTSLEREPRGPEDLVRERAAWALSQARGDRVIEPLIVALEHRDWRVRAYAAWSLAPARDPRAVPSLIRQMSHPIWRMRAMAAHALAETSDARARAVMTAAVTDEAWQVRVNGVRYLARFTDADARARLRAAQRDSHVMVRQTAERALSP
ncbi:MAG TPA: M56 family metallopeptidase [Gemmatimonadaceae bacterium]|nr:M56 family metallopeptidase [Gemmatimonadaceae bacterium]